MLDDKEVALIDRMLEGRRVGGCSDYEHLSRVYNLDDSTIRAYVKLERKVEGHPVSLEPGGEGGRGKSSCCFLSHNVQCFCASTHTGIVGSLRETRHRCDNG